MITGDVLVVGATGRVGRSLTERLVERGVTVRALVRDAARARSILGEQVCLVEGDLRDGAALPARAEGCRTVVFVAGSNAIGDRGTPREVEYDAVAALCAGLPGDRVDHVILLSSAGVTQPEHPHNCTYNSVLKWKWRGEQALRRSGLPYTIVRALGLRDRPSGQHGVRMVQGDRIAFGEDIARADLATFLADLVKPAAVHGFGKDFDRSSLLSATFEVFNASDIAGGCWEYAGTSLRSDPEREGTA